MDRDVVIHQMTERFQELYTKALDALEQAPDGQWISASEEAFHDVFHQLMKDSFQAALQAKIDTHSTTQASSFSPSEPGDCGCASDAAQGDDSGPDS
jgi:hypothetical protein